MSASSSIGPISGINYGNLITGLTQGQQSAIDAIGTRISNLQAENTAITSLSAIMTNLKIASASFVTPAVFKTGVATSANPGIVTATAGVGTPTGSYSFSVQQLASASQQVTQGFASTSTALGLSGTLTMQLGGGQLNDALNLSQLNGGNGVARGSIRITDKSGASTLVNLSQAVSVNDVINDINSASGVNVQASIVDDHLVLNDNSGGSGTLTVANAGGTTTASDLGLTVAAAGTTLTGSSLTKLAASTSLNSLNDGNGVRTAGLLNDFTINGSVSVSLHGAQTIGDVISAINTAGQTAGISAAVSADGSGITLSDSGGGPISVTAQNGSMAAYDLGIQGSGSGGTLVGSRVASDLSGPLLQDLNGGNQGQAGAVLPQAGTITINGETIDLSSASSLNDVINGINTNTQGVTATLNAAATGITLTGPSSGFTVADGTGNLASFLHIAGASGPTATGSQISSGDLHLRYISDNTQLSTLNGGSGVSMGAFSITDGNGKTQTLTLSSSTDSTIGDVIEQINASGLAISAQVNSTGDGILLTQTGGTLNAKISDLNGGTTASDLGIAGSFTNNTLDGSFQQSISIVSSDTLSSIATKLNNANPNVKVSVINDGSGTAPYRLNIASANSGAAGQVVLDGSGAGLNMTSLVQGHNAVVIYGGNANGTGGLLTTSATNTISSLVPSMPITLAGVGSTTVTVNNDPTQVTSAVQTFVTDYNNVISNIATATAFNANDPTQNGVLFGNSTVQQVQNTLGSFINQTYTNVGSLHSLADVGITVNQDGTLSLDTNTLSQILATDPTDVQKLFTTNTAAVAAGPNGVTIGTALSSLTGGGGIQPGHISIVDGNGVAHDIDLSTGISTVGDVITRINSGTGGTVTAAINSSGTGLTLTQNGGTGVAEVDEVGGGTTAASLGIKGLLTSGSLVGFFAPISPSNALQGVGITLSNLLDTWTNGQTGQLFDASDAIQTQITQLTANQTAQSNLLTQQKNQLVQQFANLEVTIAQLQSQGSALSSIQTTTTSSTKTG